jgi:hypothetical protein
MGHAANGTAAVMRVWLTALIGLPGRGPAAVADNGGSKGIGGRDSGRPAGRDRRENLHRQGNQDDWKKSLQPPAHQPPSSTELINHQQSRESRSGSQRYRASTHEIIRDRRCSRRPIPAASKYPTFLPDNPIINPKCNREWRNPNHFADCSNFEQSLPKMVTRRKEWSSNTGSGWPQGQVWWSKSREEPWRAQAASPRQSRSNPNFRGNRVDTIFRAGLPALLFFLNFLSRYFCWMLLLDFLKDSHLTMRLT